MHATIQEMMSQLRMKKIFLSALGFVATSMVIAACTELTGPKSPETPINVTATLLSATSVRVSWSPSPQSDGVVSYNILRNGTKVGESTTTSYTDTGLAEKTTYKYTVSANCTSGVLSETSAETPEATVTTADVTPPVVSSHQPPSGSTGVSTAATVSATFNELMDLTTINPATFTLKVGSTPIAGTVAYNIVTRVATFTPTPGLPSGSTITATITTGAKDIAGNRVAADFVWTFTTRDELPPTVIANSPANGASGVLVSAVVTVTFSEAMDATTITGANFNVRLSSSGALVAGTVSYNAATRVATFTPSSPLTAPTNYTVTVLTGVKDAAGNAMAAPFQFTFSTADTTPPTVVTRVPADLATNIPTNQVVSATFSEAMDATTINGTTFRVRVTATSAAVPGTVAYDPATNTATFTPTGPLASATFYTATITTGAKDVAGNALASNVTWTFITVDNVPPTVIAVTPPNGATGVAVNAPRTITITFSEAMDPTTITTSTIKVNNTNTSAAIAGSVIYDPNSHVTTFSPTVALAFGTGYTITATTGVKDASGNAMTSDFTSTFRTLDAPDITPPTVTSTVPTDAATGVATNIQIMATFSEPMDLTTISTTTFQVKTTVGGVAVPGTTTYNPGSNTATFFPSSPLANSTGYTVTITTGAKDLAGNPLAANKVFTFTTIPDTISPTVLSTAPTNGATAVPITATVKVTFSEAMDATTVTAAGTFTLKVTGPPIVDVAGTVTYNPATHVATFTPTASLLPATNYTATVTTAAKDVAGNPLSPGTVTFTFTTQ